MNRLLPCILSGLLTVTASASPNFIVIIADDMAWNDAGAYGHPNIRTPNIDRLAREGLRFDNAFLTTSSCSPSRCSILTGRYPHATGAGELHDPLPVSQVVVTESLREHGYYTAAAGKWHLGNETKAKFDTVLGGRPSGCENWVKALRDRPEDKPFFLWLAAFDPHRDYEADTIPNPHRPDDAVIPPYLPDLPEVREDFARYYDEITRMDGFIGQVLDELARQELEENTCVVFMSDNGRPFPRCKTTLFDSGVKTPFILRYPPLTQPGTASASLVSAVDLAPTILDLAGVEPISTHQGRSFVSLLRDKESSIRDYTYAEHNWHDYTAQERSVRTTRYLYIHNAYPDLPRTPPADAVRSPTYRAMLAAHETKSLTPDQSRILNPAGRSEELYDAENDPHSLNNLADAESHQDVLVEMRAALKQWSKDTADTPPPARRPDEFDRTTGERADTRPNIVLIVSDDHGADDLGCYGNASVLTPHLDRLASEGIRMDAAFTPTAMCTPSRSSLYTGLNPHRHGAHMNHGPVREDILSLPHYLGPMGYRVGLAGKTHVKPKDAFRFEYMPWEESAVSPFMQEKKSEPFCLVLAAKEPHAIKRDFPETDRFDAVTLPIPPYLVDTPETRTQRAGYYELIARLDDRVGATLDLIEKSGHADDTIVIYLSDHGAGFPFEKWTCYDAGLRIPLIARWPGHIAPGTASEAMVSIVDLLPTLVAAAGSKTVADIDGRSFLGVLTGEQAEHREIVFGAHTTRGINDGSIYPVRSARTRGYKYIRNLNPDGRFENLITEGSGQGGWDSWKAKAASNPHAAARVDSYQSRPREELYDLRADPHELNNLADDPAYGETLAALSAQLDEWMKTQGDTGIEAERAVAPHK